MITGPSFPYFASEAPRYIEDGVAGLCTGALVLPWLGILARRDDGLCATWAMAA
jgi:hypothetical protein